MKLSPKIVHPLPVAPVFVGREEEIARLKAFWADSHARVASLVGLGGVGKTALARHFLQWLLESPDAPSRPAAVFAWSFYVDQDTGKFLQGLYEYVSGRPAGGADMGLLYRLDEALAAMPPSLLVLDGLERVQREWHAPKGQPAPAGQRQRFGELEDPLMKQLVTRLAGGMGNARCLITSRFPLADIAGWAGNQYLPIALDELPAADARQLLRRRGVTGSDAALDRLLAEFGTHALTVDRLGSYLVNFGGALPVWPDAVPEPETDASTPEERKLARVLHAYESKLTDLELALLSRVCLFRFGITVDGLHTMLTQPGATAEVAGPLAGLARLDLDGLARRLVDVNLLHREPDGALTAHAAIRDHFYKRITGRAVLHKAASGLFGLELGSNIDAELKQLQQRLMNFRFRFFNRIDGHQQSDADFVNAAIQLEHATEAFVAKFEGRLPADIVREIAEVRATLAARDREAMPDLLRHDSGLMKRPGVSHLPRDRRTLDLLEELIYHTVRAGDTEGALHLYKHHLGGRKHLGKELGQFARGLRIALYFRPVPMSMDLPWYFRGAGELATALQIMDLVQPLWSGAILCLMGRLPHVTQKHWEQSRRVANLLLGKGQPLPTAVPYRPGDSYTSCLGWGEAMVDSEYFLASGTQENARRVAEAETRATGTYEPERVRSHFVLATIGAAQRDLRLQTEHLERAEAWTLASGSVEHVLLLHQTHARIHHSRDRYDAALAACDQGLQLARACGFSLFHADLAIQAARAAARLGQRPPAREYLDRARLGVTRQGEVPRGDAPPLDEMQVLGFAHPDCQYALAARRAAEAEAEIGG